MTSTINRLFKNITPLFILTIVGIAICLGEIVTLFFSKDQGELATGVLAMLALGLYITFLIDRYLIKKAGHKKVIVMEIIFLLLVPFIYLYLSKDTRIYIETERPYFLLVYNNRGLTKRQIPSSGLFDHSITFKNKIIINLNQSLLNDNNVYVIEPKTWGGYKAKYIDTSINQNNTSIQMRSNNISNVERDSIFQKLLPTLHLQ